MLLHDFVTEDYETARIWQRKWLPIPTFSPLRVRIRLRTCNGGVSSLQVAAHRKPILTLLRMRGILAALRRADVTSGVEACADPFWQPTFAVLPPFIKMSYRPHWPISLKL
jgi:hypothetical protein